MQYQGLHVWWKNINRKRQTNSYVRAYVVRDSRNIWYNYFPTYSSIYHDDVIQFILHNICLIKIVYFSLSRGEITDVSGATSASCISRWSFSDGTVTSKDILNRGTEARVYGRLLLVLIDHVLQVETLPRLVLYSRVCRRKKNNGKGISIEGPCAVLSELSLILATVV